MMMTIILAFDRIRDKDGGYVLIALQSEQTANLLWVKVLIVVYWTVLTSGSTRKNPGKKNAAWNFTSGQKGTREALV